MLDQMGSNAEPDASSASGNNINLARYSVLSSDYLNER